MEISFKNECEIKTISDIKSLKELITRRPAIQEKLKKLFQVKIYEPCLDPSLNNPTTEDNKTIKTQL